MTRNSTRSLFVTATSHHGECHQTTYTGHQALNQLQTRKTSWQNSDDYFQNRNISRHRVVTLNSSWIFLKQLPERKICYTLFSGPSQNNQNQVPKIVSNSANKFRSPILVCKHLTKPRWQILLLWFLLFKLPRSTESTISFRYIIFVRKVQHKGNQNLVLAS